MSFPINWNADPFKDRNWRFQLNAWRMLDPYVNAYFATDDVTYLYNAMEYVRDWYDFNLVRDEENEYRWYDMATGIRGMHIALLENARQRQVIDLDARDAAMLRHLAAEHVRMTRQDGISQNNHGLFQLAGLALICRAYKDDPLCEGIPDLVRSELNALMDDQFTHEGVHKEHSPDYHAFMLKAVKSIGAIQPYLDPVDFDAIEEALPWMAFPNGRLAWVGDSASRTKPLASDPVPTCLTENSCYAVGDFTSSGYAIIRDLPSKNPDSMIFMTGMSYSPTHRHADALSFELFENGRMIFVDGGKYGYEESPKRQYVLTAGAHNTVGLRDTIIGSNQYEGMGSFLSPIETGNDGFKISGSTSVTRMYTHDRTLHYWPGKALEIHDAVKATGRRKRAPFVSQLLLAPDLEPVMREDGFDVKLDQEKMVVDLIAPGCRITSARGQTDPLRGWHSPSYLELVPATSVQAECPGRKADIRWSIHFTDSSHPR